MNKITHLSADWKTWLNANVARGCTAQSMLEIMLQQNFDPEFAKKCVAQFSVPMPMTAENVEQISHADERNDADQLLAATDYSYETPRLPQNRPLIHAGDREVRVTFRIEKPVVAVLENLLSHQECDELVRQSQAKLKRSTIIDPETGREEIIAERTSSGTFFKLNENDFIARLDARIAQLMQLPLENGEGLQILHYKFGGEYREHFDFFPPTDPGSKTHLAKGGQRVSTLIIYLNDVERGGETIFPNIHLSVMPRKGSAVYFEYCNSRGQTDPATLHGGSPVTAGEKWIATKWMRQRRYA